MTTGSVLLLLSEVAQGNKQGDLYVLGRRSHKQNEGVCAEIPQRFERTWHVSEQRGRESRSDIRNRHIRVKINSPEEETAQCKFKREEDHMKWLWPPTFQYVGQCEINVGHYLQ